MNILIADDKEEGRYLLEVLLKGNGHDVTAVSNGAEAIEKLKSGGFDLIISDILMPVMDGFELCRKVKADETLRRIPFIIYTATYTDPQDEAYALKIGADRFILKPSEPEFFLKTIEEVMATAGRQDIPSLPTLKEEKETFRLYSERLVKKLEDKMMQLERTEKTLMQSEEKYRVLAEKSLQGLLIIQDFRIVFANKTAAEISGYTVEELLSLSPEKVMAMIHPDDQSLVWGHFRDRLAGKTIPARYEYRGIRKDGSVIWLEMFASFIEFDGKPAIQGAIIDITERKHIEEELKRSEEAYRNLVETARDVIFTVSPDGTLTSLNPAFHAITGWSVDDWIGKPFSLILPPDDLSLAMEKFSRGLHGELNEVFELRVSTRSGGYVIGEFIIAPEIQNGKVVNILGIARDITERKRAEQEMTSLQEQLRQSQKMEAIGRLAGGIAHDFNNLLTVIKGNSQLSLLDLRESDPLKANIEEIRSASERASDLIKQLLAFSRKPDHGNAGHRSKPYLNEA